MEIKVSEFVETEDGGYFKHYTRNEEFPDSEGRHSKLCVYCGFPTYPDCRKWCTHQGYESSKS